MPDDDGIHTVTAAAAGIRLFWEGAALSYRALFRWFRPVNYAASKILMPLAQMFFFTFVGVYGGAASREFFVLGNALQIAAVSGIYGVTMSIGGDRWEGTLAYLFASPANRMVLFSGRAAVHLIDGVVGVLIALGWGVGILGLRIPLRAVPGLLGIIAVIVYATAGLGLLMGCVGLITRNVMFVNNAVYFLLLLFSGANVKMDPLPPWLRVPGAFLPLTHGLAAARRFTGGEINTAVPGLTRYFGWFSAGEVPTLIVMEFLVGSAWAVAGYLLFRSFEIRAKRKGTLESM